MITEKRNFSSDFKTEGIDNSYVKNFELLCKNINLDINDNRFVYFIDYNYVLDTTLGMRYENLTPNYSLILKCGLEELKYRDATGKFKEDYNSVIDSICILVDRIINEINKQFGESCPKVDWFEGIKERPAKSFCEAVQRLLFINQLFWQTDHRLTGLGAWDCILYPYYKSDVESGVLNREEALSILKDVYIILHKDYQYKSNVLMGDTGQIFVLGKSTLDGDYVCNELTYILIEAMEQVQQPEPKCLLRVNSNTPNDLLEISLRAIATGIGAPLLANDDVIIPHLIEFGIEPEDAIQYTTSACWEPLIGGKSSSMNNRTVLNYLKAFDNMLSRERLSEIKSFEELVDRYLEYLKLNLQAIKRVLKSHRFEYDPLLSIFTEGCYEKGKDISQGGAKYHNVGITSVAMGNLIDSLLNIKELVFEKKKYSLQKVRKILVNNFEGEEQLLKELQGKVSYYGTDDEQVIELTRRITSCVADEINDFNDYLNGKMKVGLSGSAYMDAARGFGASFDGRKAGEAFTVHISNEDNDSFTEVINFASEMNYGNALFNGNVVDLMVSPFFIKENWDKFILLIKAGIEKGFFEIQMNVVSSETLIAAKNEPEKYPNLIVRVWGFSSYFKDLPEEYKNILIERALKNENNVA